MEHFYVTLPSDSSCQYFPRNTIANFRSKLATPIELEHDKWEVGLVEISYPKGYKKRSQYNTVRLESVNIKFPVKHYNSLHDLATNLSYHYKSSNKREQLITAFSELINSYLSPDGFTTELLSLNYGQNSVQITDKIVSHFPARVYKGLEDLTETIMAPANCRSSRLTLSTKDNSEFALPEPVYVYTDIIKPNLVGDSYVRLLTPLHFPSNTGYHRFHYPLYKPVEQSFIESIAIRLVTKTGDDVVFEDSDIPCLVILHFKKKSTAQ